MFVHVVHLKDELDMRVKREEALKKEVGRFSALHINMYGYMYMHGTKTMIITLGTF